VDEALTNIMRHSYCGRLDEPIAMYFRRAQRRSNGDTDGGLEVQLWDCGIEFDPANLPARQLQEIRPGGLGLHFIRQAMNAVEYIRVGRTNRLRLVKYFAGHEGLPGSRKENTTVQISARRVDSTTIFNVAGDIDLANSPEVRRALLGEIRKNRTPRVLMNLSKVGSIDSSGVASLVEGLKASRDLGSRLILFGLSGSAREVLRLSRLLKVFEVFDNEESALSS
jgi:anti-anti-sigma factor